MNRADAERLLDVIASRWPAAFDRSDEAVVILWHNALVDVELADAEVALERLSFPPKPVDLRRAFGRPRNALPELPVPVAAQELAKMRAIVGSSPPTRPGPAARPRPGRDRRPRLRWSRDRGTRR